MAPIRSSAIRTQFTVVRNMALNVYLPRWGIKRKVAHYPDFDLTSRFYQTCYTARRIRLSASSGIDFQEGPPDLPSPPNRLHFRQLHAEADA